MCYTISAELWKLLDDVQRPRLKEAPIPDATARPVRALPPEVEAAADARDKEWFRIEEKIRKLHERPVAKAPSCGSWRRKAKHFERERDGYVESMLCRALLCGRSAMRDGHEICPFCFRRRTTRIRLRAVRCLLDTPPEPDEPGKLGLKNLPRLGPVYIGETWWTKWEAFDKAVRRAVGGDCGRLRVRRADNTVLLVCEHPFPGSRPISPVEASELVDTTIDKLNPEQNSFRLMGSWDVPDKSEWKLVAEYDEMGDFDEVKEKLQALDVKARRCKLRSVEGLIYRTTREIANALAMLYLSEFHHEEESSYRTNSDKSPPDGAEPPDEEHFNPFDPGECQWD